MSIGSAININTSILAPRLEAHLRWQSYWIFAGLTIGLPLCALGMVLGLLSIAAGLPSGSWRFITRGIAWIAMSGLLMWGLLPLTDLESRTTGAASEMVDLAIERVQRTLGLVRAGLYVCIIPVVFGLVRMVFKSHFARPPRLSPIVALEILALIALTLVVCAWQLRVGLRKYRALGQAIASDTEAKLQK